MITKPDPIKLPLPPGKILVFDHIKGEIRIDDIGRPMYRPL